MSKGSKPHFPTGIKPLKNYPYSTPRTFTRSTSIRNRNPRSPSRKGSKHSLKRTWPEKPLYFDCFDPAQEFVRQLFELRYFEEFQNSIYYKKHELGPLLQSFIEFVKEKEDQDMVQFLVACDTYESNVETLEDNEALDDAMALYEKFDFLKKVIFL
ncbi:unnamed protein product [Caenorhabditis auriculariae]|uniref:RGS domain-containing protein n=1 Tax=Caenorhabditis auriculariae TaxID=2777116 RepID=A0A8S1HT44_9PELO|nr:unnamed protein product [Caenorhabditis auriculariae]